MFPLFAVTTTVSSSAQDLPGTNLPFWWLDTTFGSLIFILSIVTWGLVIVALILLVLFLVRKITENRGKKR